MKDNKNFRNKSLNKNKFQNKFQNESDAEDNIYERDNSITKKPHNKNSKNEKYSKKKSFPVDREEENSQKLKNYEEEILIIKNRLSSETPPCGFYYFNKSEFNLTDSESEKEVEEKQENEVINHEEEIIEKNLWKKEKFYFKDLPISKKTLKGLSEGKFVKMTPVQRYTLPHSLISRDILGASKTGSGKTLCFIIPVLECLYKQRWTSLDGLGALLILPTRELAMQVFEVFRIIGKYHDFSIGLVIGGNNLQVEKDSLYKINILIGTPGRLSQHFTETPLFTTENLQILCIDEADRILDEGFETALNEIISYLPTKNRQTLLFSATLTKSLKRLAKVNLKSPEYISVNNTDAFLSVEKAENADETEKGINLQLDKINLKLKDDTKDSNKAVSSINISNSNNNNDLTPINLNQVYSICETHEKIDFLFSFLKSHKNVKCIVFVSSCKQVRYYTEIFKRLKLGMTFLDLHGKQKQNKRQNIFYTFLNKKNTVLFATDVASRGVDFPSVDWVIQLDCPDDISTYIHRVGRTARYKSKGNSLLFVNKKEEKLVSYLQNKNVNIRKIKINISKVVGLQPILRSIISENSELIHLAQKAIKSYLKSIHLQSNKEIFDLQSIDIQQLALSYGLVNLPEIRITKKSENELKNMKKTIVNAGDDFDSSDDEKERKKSKLQKLKEKIALKKQQKSQEVNEIMQKNESAVKISKEELKENSFLKLKRKNEIKGKMDEFDMKNVNNEKKVNNDKTLEEKQIIKNAFYDKLKAKLILNEDEDKIKEKARIFDKHRADRLRSKQFDYDKHGLNGNGENEEDSEDEQNFDENIHTELPLKETHFNNKKVKNMKNMDQFIDSDGETYNFKFAEDKKLKDKGKNKSEVKKDKIDFDKANIEDKEKFALEVLLQKKLFG